MTTEGLGGYGVTLSKELRAAARVEIRKALIDYFGPVEGELLEIQL